MSTCQDLCRAYLDVDACAFQTECVGGITCVNLYWTDREKNSVILAISGESNGDEENMIPVTCDEAKRAWKRRRSRDDDSSSSAERRSRSRVVIAEEHNSIRKFHKELPVTEYTDVPNRVEGIELNTFKKFFSIMGDKLEIVPSLFLVMAQPIGECLGHPPSVEVTDSDGSKITVSFDETVLRYAPRNLNVPSLDGQYMLSRIHPPNMLNKIKLVLSTLDGLDNTIVRVFDLKPSMKNFKCERELIVRENIAIPISAISHALSIVDLHAIASRSIHILSKLHSVGLVHNRVDQGLVWDGSDVDSLRLSRVEDVYFFVDSRYQHVPCLEENCFSRKRDLGDLIELLTVLRRQLGSSPNAFSEKLTEFDDYVRSLDWTDNPDYTSCIETFTTL